MTGDGKVSSRGINSLLCIIVFEKLTDKSIIAILNTMKSFTILFKAEFCIRWKLTARWTSVGCLGWKRAAEKSISMREKSLKKLRWKDIKTSDCYTAGNHQADHQGGYRFIWRKAIKIGLTFQQRAELFWGHVNHSVQSSESDSK